MDIFYIRRDRSKDMISNTLGMNKQGEIRNETLLVLPTFLSVYMQHFIALPQIIKIPSLKLIFRNGPIKSKGKRFQAQCIKLVDPSHSVSDFVEE